MASRRLAKIALGVAAGLCLALALAVAVIVAGFGDTRLRIEAEKAVAGLAGAGFDVGVGSVAVFLDGFRGLALQIDGIAISPVHAEAGSSRIGSARFGLAMLPLLRGELKVSRIAVSDTTIALDALAPPEIGTGRFKIMDENGLVDPDLVNAAAFDALREMARLLDQGGMRRIEARDVEIVLPGERAGDGPGTVPGTVYVSEATLQRKSAEGVRLSATLRARDRTLTIQGEAALDRSTRRVSALDLRLDIPPVPPAETKEGDDPPAQPLAAASLALSGAEAGAGGRLTLSGRIEGIDIPVSRRERLVANVDFVASAMSGTGKLEIDRLRIASGRSVWDFHGAFGPAPKDAPDSEWPASYRYELVSDGSSVSPGNSSEPTLRVGARIAGHLDAGATTLRADEIGVRSGQGEVTGRGTLRLEPGKSPGLDLRIDASAMPISHAKQLWPWFAAPSAQRWVTTNVFGGEIEGGWVELAVAPGRFGDGVELGHREVSGFFRVRGTRFDVAGRIPPVRDGSGSVAFFGTDVEIALSSGTVYMPSGRTVAASGGTLSIHDAHIRPVIGKLDIEVAGEADAVLELASYEPINVGRFVDLKPDDLGGAVSGKVAADIPLQSGIARESLGWRVELAYRDLDIARAFEGQSVADATGTILVDPQKAVIEAEARLNGLPATLRLTEPLGDSPFERQRQITIDMDDDVRAALAPGLDMLLSGVARVEIDGGDAGAGRAVKADLRPVALSIPWIGWSKGPGVPASVSFAMKSANGRTELSGFNLRGDTFAASGTVSLRDNTVERVHFPAMRLNRGDDFSLDVARNGAGYAVTVRGRSLDARSAIKLYARDGDSESGSGEGAATPVTLDLKVDTLTGFHGESLRDVTLRYSGTGSRGELTEFSAVTAGGERVLFRDAMEGEARGVTMQSDNAGALLRFLDIYARMEGGRIALSLAGRGSGALRGQIDARDFWLVNEPRLSSIVSTPTTQDGRSLNQAVRGSLDTSRVQFERGYAEISRGAGALSLDRGILRGPLIGVSFQGILNDGRGNMSMTGTFMPAYGLNRIFGEIPLIGQILGNGRDRGLIGITFRLAGRAEEPRLEINPLSVIAPGIFRSVFEFR